MVALAMRLGNAIKALDKENKPIDALIEQVEKIKAIRAKVEHPFRVIKRQFGYTGALPGAHEEHAAAHYALRYRTWDGAPPPIAERDKCA